MTTFWARLAWDGALPLVVALVPLGIEAIGFEDQEPKILLGVLPAPFAALLRAHIGAGQIRKVCGGELPVLRQLGLGLAIIILMVFEASVAIVAFAEKIPRSGWFFPAAAYVLYVAIVAITLRPPRGQQPADEWEWRRDSG